VLSPFSSSQSFALHPPCISNVSISANESILLQVKGTRERDGEDEACALLTLRALDALVNGQNTEFAEHGVKLTDCETSTNAVGESSLGVENVPNPGLFLNSTLYHHSTHICAYLHRFASSHIEAQITL
jgi:hypothetical protein